MMYYTKGMALVAATAYQDRLERKQSTEYTAVVAKRSLTIPLLI